MAVRGLQGPSLGELSTLRKGIVSVKIISTIRYTDLRFKCICLIQVFSMVPIQSMVIPWTLSFPITLPPGNVFIQAFHSFLAASNVHSLVLQLLL